MKAPLVSIIIPTFNADGHLASCLDQLLLQHDSYF